MTNLKVINPGANIADDPDVFIRVCDSQIQRQRREARREADRKRREQERGMENLLCAVAGALVTFFAMTLPILF